jgi:hypothetical protein
MPHMHRLGRAPPDAEIRLIVAADEPALFFSSVEAAETYLEAIDVEDGVYGAAHGTHGEPYVISTSGNRVIVRLDPTRSPQPDELKKLVKAFFAAIGQPDAEDEPLPAMLARCTRFLTY